MEGWRGGGVGGGVESERDSEVAEPGASGLEIESLLKHFPWDWPWMKIFPL